MPDRVEAVATKLGHRFDDPSLLVLALTHPSFAAEQAQPIGSNGRLEFLGDAVLGLVVSAELYDAWDLSEGEMTKARASLVDESTLAEVGALAGIPAALRLGRGEEASGGREKAAIVADATEAVLAAVYLDGGFAAVRRVILDLWRPLIRQRAVAPGERDHKSMLQEVLATRGDEPEYEVVGSGPDHLRRFDAQVLVDGEVVGRGWGSSKKRAQQAAARDALTRLDTDDA